MQDLYNEAFIDELEKIAGDNIKDKIKKAGRRVKREAKTYKREFGDMYGKGGIAREFAKDVGSRIKSEAKQYGEEFNGFYGKGGVARRLVRSAGRNIENAGRSAFNNTVRKTKGITDSNYRKALRASKEHDRYNLLIDSIVKRRII